MAYTPPSSNDVELIIETGYTPPDSSNVELIISVGGVEYVISLSDRIQLSHADKRDLGLSLEEILILIDSLYYRSNLYNTILNSVSIGENKKDKIGLSLSDVLALNELLYYASAFYELLQENISLQENFNAGFLFEQAISDIISISEQLNLLIRVNPKESLFTLEKAIYDINTKLKEEVSLSESAEIKRVLITLLSEVIALNEIAGYLYSALMQKKEALNLSEKQINRLELALTSTLTLSEDLAKSLSIICKDDITISELSKLSLVASLITDILLSENVKRDTKVKILSLLKIDEKVISYIGLIPHEERTLYSLIVLSKLLNSDIVTLREIYSLIKKEEEL